MLPKMAFTGFASRYREPTTAEGFAEIIKNDFKVRRSTHASMASQPCSFTIATAQ